MMRTLTHSRSCVTELPHKKIVQRLYKSLVVELTIAILIGLNFLAAALEAQLRPQQGEVAWRVFYVLEWFFGTIFLVELLVNMYGSWFKEFWMNGWNLFDFFIVCISIMSLAGDMPGIDVLRLFRAFRVFRLFKRVPSLRIIVVGVVKSAKAVSQAFIILAIFMAIWAIMGVDFFGDLEDTTLFGSWSAAMFTLFQVWSGDSWCSGIARPIVLGKDFTGAIFFISYMFINGILMTNVVIAILLEQYLGSKQDIETQKQMREEAPIFAEGMEKNLEKFKCVLTATQISELELAISQLKEIAASENTSIDILQKKERSIRKKMQRALVLANGKPSQPPTCTSSKLENDDCQHKEILPNCKLTAEDLRLQQMLASPLPDVLSDVQAKIDNEAASVRKRLAHVRARTSEVLAEFEATEATMAPVPGHMRLFNTSPNATAATCTGGEDLNNTVLE